MTKELLVRESEGFKVGYTVGLVSALDSIMALRNVYVDLDEGGPTSLRTYKSAETAILDFHAWLFGDASGPSDFKVNFMDECPVAVMSSPDEIPHPPNVKLLRGVRYGNKK